MGCGNVTALPRSRRESRGVEHLLPRPRRPGARWWALAGAALPTSGGEERIRPREPSTMAPRCVGVTQPVLELKHAFADRDITTSTQHNKVAGYIVLNAVRVHPVLRVVSIAGMHSTMVGCS